MTTKNNQAGVQFPFQCESSHISNVSQPCPFLLSNGDGPDVHSTKPHIRDINEDVDKKSNSLLGTPATIASASTSYDNEDCKRSNIITASKPSKDEQTNPTADHNTLSHLEMEKIPSNAVPEHEDKTHTLGTTVKNRTIYSPGDEQNAFHVPIVRRQHSNVHELLNAVPRQSILKSFSSPTSQQTSTSTTSPNKQSCIPCFEIQEAETISLPPSGDTSTSPSSQENIIPPLNELNSVHTADLENKKSNASENENFHSHLSHHFKPRVNYESQNRDLEIEGLSAIRADVHPPYMATVRGGYVRDLRDQSERLRAKQLNKKKALSHGNHSRMNAEFPRYLKELKSSGYLASSQNAQFKSDQSIKLGTPLFFVILGFVSGLVDFLVDLVGTEILELKRRIASSSLNYGERFVTWIIASVSIAVMAKYITYYVSKRTHRGAARGSGIPVCSQKHLP